MTRVSFWHPAGTFDVPGKGEFPQQFAPGAFDRSIGKRVPVTGPGGEDLGLCTLVAADVAEDGRGVTITFELPEGHDPGPVVMRVMSFAFFPPPEPEPELRDPAAPKPPRITWKT